MNKRKYECIGCDNFNITENKCAFDNKPCYKDKKCVRQIPCKGYKENTFQVI